MLGCLTSNYAPGLGYPCISKVMKASLPNFNEKDFRSLESTEEKNGGSGITASYFPTLMNLTIFGHFSQFRAKG